MIWSIVLVRIPGPGPWLARSFSMNQTAKPSSRANKIKEEDDDISLLKVVCSGYIETDTAEKSFHIKQDQILEHVAVQNAKKRFDLKLPSPAGGYCVDYTRNGRFLLAGSASGHLAAFDWMAGKLQAEITVNEPIRDVAWLQNEMIFAAAQKSGVFIYDHTGTELHHLKKHADPSHLEYLPYHFLLFSACGDNYVRYHDISTGLQISESNTRAGISTASAQNPSNGITFTGHSGGTVSLWSPTVNAPLVKMFTHRGPVRSISVDSEGLRMVTAGADGYLKVWDLRTFKSVSQSKLPGRAVDSLSISQTGLVAAAAGPNITVWKNLFDGNQKSLYMRHVQSGEHVKQIAFCPYDDLLAAGHTGGISSLLIPGSGEANFDAFEANPFANKKQRQEAQVKQLLDKLGPETIALDPYCIGMVVKDSVTSILSLQRTAAVANGREPPKPKGKKGKGSAQRRLARKRENIINEAKALAQEKLKQQTIVNLKEQDAEKSWSALDRFR